MTGRPTYSRIEATSRQYSYLIAPGGMVVRDNGWKRRHVRTVLVILRMLLSVGLNALGVSSIASIASIA